MKLRKYLSIITFVLSFVFFASISTGGSFGSFGTFMIYFMLLAPIVGIILSVTLTSKARWIGLLGNGVAFFVCSVISFIGIFGFNQP